MTIKITSDSTIDLPREILERYGIATMPLEVHLGDDVFEDGVTVDPGMIYAYVEKTGRLPKTAARNETAYRDFFEENLRGADCVIHYSLSSGISSSYDEATKAARAFGGSVRVLDTLALSTGTALLAIDGAERARAGESPEAIAARAESRIPRVQTSFVIDKLEFLYKGGRCSRLQVLGSNMLKIKPTIEMREGTLYVGKKFRGTLVHAARAYVDSIFDRYNTPDLTRIFVTHTEMDPEIVEAVKSAVAERFEFRETIETIAGSTITSHCGKGTIGILYLNDGDRL